MLCSVCTVFLINVPNLEQHSTYIYHQCCCECAAPPPDGSSLYSSDQPNDSGGPKTTTTGVNTTTTTADNLDRDYDIITPLPTQYSRLYRPSLSPSPPQQDGLNSHQHSFCTTTTVLTDFGSFKASGEPCEMADMGTKRPNGHINSTPDVHEALYCITSLSSLHHQANQLWSNKAMPISPPPPVSSAHPVSNIVYHVLENTASDTSGTGVTGVVAGGTETVGTRSSKNTTFQDTLPSQPFPVHGSEDAPFSLVLYETPIPSLVQNGTLDGTGSIRDGNQACSLEYNLPPDAVAISAMQVADYSEPDDQSGHFEDVQTVRSIPDVQTSCNYEVLSTTTMEPKSCYTRLKLGKHTVV